MSRRTRNRENLSPSLFPFLAVLLCTMGALVLILMLVVGQAQATATQAATAKRYQQEEIAAQLAMLKESFTEQRAQGQLELEKKRLSLQAFEKQIQQSMEELEQVARSLELTDDEKSASSIVHEDSVRRKQELEKKLQLASEKLKQKIDDPKGDKPVFSIIPYDGPNGTFRRPIYLECTADGILVQPEGVLISQDDLRPPHGPGNPLDAVLRTVRSRYAPASGALTSTAYPLLVVRSSGIQTYALARLAMSGWDDQFGYELIDDSMELEFPEGEHGLRAEIEKSLALARSRQSALVMAMPGKYRSYVESFGSDEYEPLTGGASGGSRTSSGENSAANNTINSGFAGGSEARQGEQYSSIEPGQYASGTRGAWVLPKSDLVGSGVLESPDVGGSSTNVHPDFGPTRPNLMNGEPGTLSGATTSNIASGGASLGRRDSTAPGPPGRQNSDATNGSAREGADESPASKDSRSNFRATEQSRADSNGQGSNGSAQIRPGATAMSMPQSPANSSTAPSSQSSDMPSDPMNMNFSFNEKAIQPVAKQKGRNWALSPQSSPGTAVVRSIRVTCAVDRWIVHPEVGSLKAAQTVLLDKSPADCAQQLAKIIAERVDRWGLAIMGGYWKPVLAVEVSPGAEIRYAQLFRLLEGSGLEIRKGSTNE